MTRSTYSIALGLLVVALTAGAQPPQPEHRDDQYKDDPHAICRKGPDDPDAPSEHSCSCQLMCSDGTEQAPAHQIENPSCALYCSRQRCLCHVDNNCDKPPVI